MGHAWVVTFHLAHEKEKVVKQDGFHGQAGKCLVIDPNDREVRMKLHWVPYHADDNLICKALELYGKVVEITRERWGSGGFEGAPSTTRIIRMKSGKGGAVERIPYPINMIGTKVLVSVAGRPPQCLRCREKGHIRKQCRVPRFKSCRTFGHDSQDCLRTYVTLTRASIPTALDTEYTLDEHDMEEVKGMEGCGGSEQKDGDNISEEEPQLQAKIPEWKPTKRSREHHLTKINLQTTEGTKMITMTGVLRTTLKGHRRARPESGLRLRKEEQDLSRFLI